MTQFIAVKDVAKILHVSKDTVRRIVHEGSLNAYKIGSQLKFTAEDVEVYLENSKTNLKGNDDDTTTN